MEWHLVLAAVVTGTSIHAVMEPDNIMRKLHRLKYAIKTGKIQELPMKGIDTRVKAWSVGVVFIGLLSGIAYLVANLLDPSPVGAMQYSVVIVVLAELVLMMRIDRYHVEIEKITQAQKKK